jgi:hypothetical protein
MLYGFEPQGLKDDAEFGIDIAGSFIEKVQSIIMVH